MRSDGAGAALPRIQVALEGHLGFASLTLYGPSWAKLVRKAGVRPSRLLLGPGAQCAGEAIVLLAGDALRQSYAVAGAGAEVVPCGSANDVREFSPCQAGSRPMTGDSGQEALSASVRVLHVVLGSRVPRKVALQEDRRVPVGERDLDGWPLRLAVQHRNGNCRLRRHDDRATPHPAPSARRQSVRCEPGLVRNLSISEHQTRRPATRSRVRTRNLAPVRAKKASSAACVATEQERHDHGFKLHLEGHLGFASLTLYEVDR